jgi:uncharacterized protein (UPF0335 family)
MMSEVVEGLEAWISSGSAGASAKSIAAHLGGSGQQPWCYPIDAGDFGRCELLLDMVPSFRADLGRMAEVNAYWAELVASWDDIRAADDRSAAIMAIVKPISELDPGHLDLGGVGVRLGGAVKFSAEDLARARSEGSVAAGMRRADADLRKLQGKPPMKPDPEFDAARDNAYRVTASELRSFIERYERLEAEKKDIAAQQKEVMAEAKARGYVVKILRAMVKLRSRDADDIAEEEALLEMYKEALGM